MSEPTTPMQVSTTAVLIGQIKVMAQLLQAHIGVARTLVGNGDTAEDDELLQDLVDQSEAAIAAVLTEHAMGGQSHG